MRPSSGKRLYVCDAATGIEAHVISQLVTEGPAYYGLAFRIPEGEIVDKAGEQVLSQMETINRLLRERLSQGDVVGDIWEICEAYDLASNDLIVLWRVPIHTNQPRPPALLPEHYSQVIH